MTWTQTDEERVRALIEEGSRRALEAAFDLLYNALRVSLLAVCANLTRHTQDAEDALQETLLAIHKGLAAFRGESQVKTWAFKIAIRRALHVRAARHRAPTPDGGELSDLGGSADPTPGLESVDALRHGLAQLSAEHRTVLVLFGVQGLSHQEIADILGVPAGTVWSRLHEGRKRLAAALS